VQQTRLLDKVEEAAASPDLMLAQALSKGGRRLLRSKIERHSKRDHFVVSGVFGLGH
jgi:hypothetical protein